MKGVEISIVKKKERKKKTYMNTETDSIKKIPK